MVIKNDAYLLVAAANERSITHRLAIYLEAEFPEYNVDCEYNKNGSYPKRLINFRKTINSDNTDGVTVYPDIIVHHRGTNDNFIVIEAKKSSNTDLEDREKLQVYKTELSYTHAFFVKFPVGEDLNNFNLSSINEFIEVL